MSDYNQKRTFTDVGVDPVKGAEIFSLVGIRDSDFVSPQRVALIKDVVSYFQSRPNMKHEISKVLYGNPHEDRLHLLWTYSNIQIEKQKAIESLDREKLSEELQAKIDEGHLPKSDIERTLDEINMKKEIIVKNNLVRRQKERELKSQAAEHARKRQASDLEQLELEKMRNDLEHVVDIENKKEYHGW